MDLVPRRQKNMRRPIKTVISGRPVELVTIGWVARAFGRTTSTIKYWERIGLFPRAPFRHHRNVPSANRRLYPRQFVTALTEIGKKDVSCTPAWIMRTGTVSMRTWRQHSRK